MHVPHQADSVAVPLCENTCSHLCEYQLHISASLVPMLSRYHQCYPRSQALSLTSVLALFPGSLTIISVHNVLDYKAAKAERWCLMWHLMWGRLCEMWRLMWGRLCEMWPYKIWRLMWRLMSGRLCEMWPCML